ncbi:hypothetical protein QTP88_020076 [Uroleucon formosanum]
MLVVTFILQTSPKFDAVVVFYALGTSLDYDFFLCPILWLASINLDVLETIWSSDSPMITISSAYTGKVLFPTSSMDLLSFITLIIYSSAKLKKFEDKASPCLNPVSNSKLSDTSPIYRTWQNVFSLQLLTNLTSFEGIPKFLSIV